VDDLQILSTPCSNPLSCNFENGFCTYWNRADDDTDWLLYSPQTKNFNRFLPFIDHTLQSDTGYYSVARLNGRVGNAVLVSDQHPSTAGLCLRFSYAIYGDALLHVYLETAHWNVSQLQVSNSDNSQQWKTTQLDITSNDPFFLAFEAQRPLKISLAFVALDDVQVLDGLCAAQTSAPPPTTPTMPAELTYLECDFDHSLCGWSQSHNDTFDWTRNSGRTTTDGTGPEFDHTQGTNAGSYMHIDVSYKRPNSTAVLRSLYMYNADPTCFTFWYHMHGPHVNRLNVRLINGSGPSNVIWYRQGEQGLQWKQATIEIPPIRHARVRPFCCICNKSAIKFWININ
jgi:hypothetical protein